MLLDKGWFRQAAAGPLANLALAWLKAHHVFAGPGPSLRDSQILEYLLRGRGAEASSLELVRRLAPQTLVAISNLAQVSPEP